MDTQQLREFYEQNFYYIVGIQVFVGLIFGLIPFLIALKRGKRKLGVLALVVSLILAGLSPLLSAVAAIVFTFFAMRRRAGGGVDPSDAE